MPIPNYQSHVADAAARYPDAWRHAHTGGPRTEEFIRLLARDLHAIDPNVGLNGKRGNPDDISDDALAVYTDDGDVTDRTGRRMVIVDVIVGAGGPNPQPGWASVGGPSPGAWVQPEAVDAPTPTPQPTPQPIPPSPDYSARLDAIQSSQVFLINQLAQLRNDVLQQHAQLHAAVDKLNALGLEVVDVRNALSTGLAIEADVNLRTPLGTVRGTVAGTAKV
jgi:hypothetical protein